MLFGQVLKTMSDSMAFQVKPGNADCEPLDKVSPVCFPRVSQDLL